MQYVREPSYEQIEVFTETDSEKSFSRMIPHMCQLKVTQAEFYDCIQAEIYSIKFVLDMWNLVCSRHI